VRQAILQRDECQFTLLDAVNWTAPPDEPRFAVGFAQAGNRANFQDMLKPQRTNA
jgi:hypothetical protein